jgi:hypothetical protein
MAIGEVMAGQSVTRPRLVEEHGIGRLRFFGGELRFTVPYRGAIAGKRDL